MELKYIPISEIKPYENNPRNNDTAVEYVAESIRQFGFKNPVILTNDNVIVAGHTRIKAAKKLGIEEIPCIYADDLTEDEIKAFRIADNKVAELAQWDFEKLEDELASIEIDMSDFGFQLKNDDDYEIEYDKSNAEWFDKKLIQNKIIENWKNFSLEEFVGNIMDEATAMHQFNRLCQGYNDGYNISLLFNPHRLTTKALNNDSDILYGFNNDIKYKEQFARFLVDTQNKCVVPSQYYKFIGLGTAGYQYVNEFQPYLARDIYRRFCSDGDKILNPCAGWGGRLLGIASCRFNDIEYVETDPQKQTYNGLVKIKTWLGLSDNYRQYNMPFELLELDDNYFDFVFTSPPYFNTELYDDDEMQSYKKGDNYIAWKNNWYFPFLDKILRVMKKDAVCVLNVGNARYPMEKDTIIYLEEKHKILCTSINDYKIGGSGIGKRTGENGEPFIKFVK